MSTCDICGKEGRGLAPLQSCYATDKIKVGCPECIKLVNDQLRALRKMSNKMNENFLKRFIDNLKHKLGKL